MPITCPIPIRPLSQDEFKQLDFGVMRLAFDSQNDLGRLCDESIYSNDLLYRILAANLTAQREVPIAVTHKSFSKIYSVDLIVENSAPYELKAAESLVAEHESQLLNYMLLLGVGHSKLINFRPAKVQSRFVNANLTPEGRTKFQINATGWRELDSTSSFLKSTVIELVSDWGLFLELPLYREALIHFLGGEHVVVQPVRFTRGGHPLGAQAMPLLSPSVSFRVTAFTEPESYREHLHNLLRLTPLTHIQWINMNRHIVEFVTVSK